jgi:hypothetical protein
MGQNNSVESIIINQTFFDYDIDVLKRKVCREFKVETFPWHLNFHVIYSPPQRISIIDLEFYCISRIDELDIKLSISPYRNCAIVNKKPQSNKFYKWTFICELESFEDYKNETNFPTTIKFSFKSEKIFYLEICRIQVHRFQDSCGAPDIPLHASYNRLNDTSFEYFPIVQRNKHRMIGDGVITCSYEGNWDKEPPIFEPIIKCNTNEIDINSNLYKIIKLHKYEFFNKTQVAVIDSKILFQCNNEENLSKLNYLTCNENGSWIGGDLKCKLEA